MKQICVLYILLGMFKYATSYSLPYKINGPKSYNDRIAIIGAGPSGIHMAHLLKKKGFTNVEILEKSNRIGGKSYSVNHRGTVHDLGTCYLQPDHQDNAIDLVKIYVPADLVDLPLSSIWLDNMVSPISYKSYIGGFALKFYNTTNTTLALVGILNAGAKYIKLHRDMFGDYDGEIMPKPNATTMHQIRGTFLDYLARNKLQVLLPLFYAGYSQQGYGRVDEVAAFYGLIWNTPAFIGSLLKRMKGENNTRAEIFLLKSGFQNLWETVAKKDNLTIKYQHDVVKMYRRLGKDPLVFLTIENKSINRTLISTYKFVIWSPEMKESLPSWFNIINEEQELFSLTTKRYFTTSLVDSLGYVRGNYPISYWMDNMMKKREDSVWSLRDSYATLHGYTGSSYLNNTLPNGDDGTKFTTTVFYQMSTAKTEKMELMKGLKAQLESIGAKNITVRQMVQWDYFPRYSSTEIESGVIWKILEMQGKYGMWYIGSSSSFESVKSVMEYNKLIVENMSPIQSESSSAVELHSISMALAAFVVVHMISLL